MGKRAGRPFEEETGPPRKERGTWRRAEAKDYWRPRIYQLETQVWLPREVRSVFHFFADARNLELITPPWLHFKIITPEPIEMRAGATIDYRLRLHGWPIRWQSKITHWEPPDRFIDEQRRGPYKAWTHEHLFESVAGGTWVVDRVHYDVPLGTLVQRWFVGPDLRRIFEYRKKRLSKILAPQPQG